MRHLFAGLALCLLAVPPALAAAPGLPAPNEDAIAKEKLEKLKKRLPDVAAGWMGKHWGNTAWGMELRSLRRTAAAEAKASFLIRYVGKPGDPPPDADSGRYVVSVYLNYFDGAWTTTRFETSLNPPHGSVLHLLLAIDEIELD